ncbi:integrase domain-containing protein [Crenobacter sp. SG2305]|uniref:tyrosine-type recombinase/integrase n=1 Tax=Crenobacter oryzisoli TaxID=3056844 RepID=UPI0025AAB56A|nr:integrase domain-containing protein [Crenobacter sp. SG2305]MDN0082466.1 integrase domain-containing protein [Crenobacter sp. SG2305]
MALSEQEKSSRRRYFQKVCRDIRQESADIAATYSQTHRGKPARGDWKRELSRLVGKLGDLHATRVKKVSLSTLASRREILFMCFGTLRELGFKPQSIFSIGSRHVQALFSHWEENGLSASTLQTRHTILTTFSEWIGKPGLIQPLGQYLKHPANGKRTYVAQQDKSWSAQNLLTDELIAAVSNYDKRVGIQLKLIRAFGLRRKEAICFRPHFCLEPDGQHIQVYQGTKGGRFRVIPISNEQQREVLAEAMAMCPRHIDHVGDPDNNLEQNIRRLQYVLERFGITRAKLGVTAHGLRHEYANNRYRQLTGEESPLRGGDPRLFSLESTKLKRRQVAEELGHSRISVTTAYYGSARSTRQTNPASGNDIQHTPEQSS